MRLKGYDYTQPGAYFVTICIHDRLQLLSSVAEAKATPTSIGAIIIECWRMLPTHFANISIDAWIVMPDHLHGIVVIRQRENAARPPCHSEPRGTIPGSLPAIIQNFKSVSTRRANQFRGTPGTRLWQEDYYEHIIRGDQEFNRIRRYIHTNPIRWNR